MNKKIYQPRTSSFEKYNQTTSALQSEYTNLFSL